ncbi:MAG: reverse transcriptase domain-containing protein [Nanoarchaeota archaeon]
MTAYRDLWQELCALKNLELAFKKARKGKPTKLDVVEFEHNLKDNLLRLRIELLFHSYKPRALETFILRDPKTRKISKSDFRDRIVHHALCNIIEPMFEKQFIYDSYANRKRKGTLKAIQRFEHFIKKGSKQHSRKCFILKADVKKYFENVDQDILVSILKRKIKDQKILWLIKIILSNYHALPGKGMPLGNLTSQFFANVYLNELDQFVKKQLKAKYYIRYVDDFAIIHLSKDKLDEYKEKVDKFLKEELALQLHPDKSKIIPYQQGVPFLGMKVFPYHKLIIRKNVRKFRKRISVLNQEYILKKATYDKIYDFVEGWDSYAKQADAFKLRKKFLKDIECNFPGEISTKEINRLQPNALKPTTKPI